MGNRDPFLNLAPLYPEHAQRTTLAASDVDLPVPLSAKLHDAPRAELLGHSYFAQAEARLHDRYDLIRHGAPPAVRQFTHSRRRLRLLEANPRLPKPIAPSAEPPESIR